MDLSQCYDSLRTNLISFLPVSEGELNAHVGWRSGHPQVVLPEFGGLCPGPGARRLWQWW